MVCFCINGRLVKKKQEQNLTIMVEKNNTFNVRNRKQTNKNKNKIRDKKKRKHHTHHTRKKEK
jgi:hypothetical protein